MRCGNHGEEGKGEKMEKEYMEEQESQLRTFVVSSRSISSSLFRVICSQSLTIY